MKMKEDSEKAGLKLNIKKMKIIASCLITSWQINGEKLETGTDFIFLGSKITAVTAAMKLKDAPWKKSYDKPRLRTKKQRHHFADIVKSYGFSSSHMQT